MREDTISEPKTIVRTAEPISFEDFYVDLHRDLYAAMWLITRSRHEAEEIAQDAFLKVLERWDRVQKLDDPEGYLYRTATNAWRSRGRRAAVAVRRAVHGMPADDSIATAEQRVDLLRGLAILTPRQRAAVG